MALSIPRQARERMIASIKRYFAQQGEEEIGDLKAELLLQFCLEEICPTVYNRAIADAQAYLLRAAEDLEGSCFEAEFGYWERER